MSGTDSKWAELTDLNERIVRPGEAGYDAAGVVRTTLCSQWAELASQRERLADSSDPLFGLASSSHVRSSMRLVASLA
jgi:hypothetical protein